jgi:hypothetical protein
MCNVFRKVERIDVLPVPRAAAMKIVNPRDFRSAFLSVMNTERDSYRMAAGFEAKSYSYFMRSNIFPKVAKQLGLLSWNKEYYGLDGIFYEERGTDSFGKYTAFAKWISVALAHENKPTKTHDEIYKLQMFNAPLKVLITYADPGVDSELLLRNYELIIRDSDIFDDFSTLRQQLVILGSPKEVAQWRFYVYEGDGFVFLLPEQRKFG